MNRSEHLARLREAPLDVLILGGGINGAGVARDLALRARGALRIALVEQRQFGSGTSGRNSQLIHGGLRYLKGLEFGLVREALRERATLLALAPHLVEPLQFLLPMYGARLYYTAGLWIYDVLAGSRNIARHRGLSREEVLNLEPGLAPDGLSGGALFFDARVHSARFVLENVADAARAGAIVVNYARAEPRAGDAIRVTDALSGETFDVRARKLVDATGPWSNAPGIRLVRGSHLVLPRLNQGDHAIAWFESRGRIVFVIPWGPGRKLSLVGTTDIDHHGSPEDVHMSDEEVRYLRDVAGRLFPTARGVAPIAAFSSLRALVDDRSASPADATRGHRIWNTPDGVLHISGGKYTTYRAMSEEAADQVAREIAPPLARLHPTATEPLGGNTRQAIDDLLASAPHLAADSHLRVDELTALVREYGVATPRLLTLLREPAAPGLSRLETARIAYAIHHEMAQRLADVLYISTYWGYELRWTPDMLRPYGLAMAQHLGWDQRRVAEEIESLQHAR